jgi:hypothetical protein
MFERQPRDALKAGLLALMDDPQYSTQFQIFADNYTGFANWLRDFLNLEIRAGRTNRKERAMRGPVYKKDMVQSLDDIRSREVFPDSRVAPSLLPGDTTAELSLMGRPISDEAKKVYAQLKVLRGLA